MSLGDYKLASSYSFISWEMTKDGDWDGFLDELLELPIFLWFIYPELSLTFLFLSSSYSYFACLTSAGSSLPSTGKNLSGTHFINQLIINADDDTIKHISHWSLVRPPLWTFIANPPNYTINIWPKTIVKKTPINIAFVKIPAKMFHSSLIFLAVIILNIYRKTKRLNITVKCLEGVAFSKCLYMSWPSNPLTIPLSTYCPSQFLTCSFGWESMRSLVMYWSSSSGMKLGPLNTKKNRIIHW